MSDSEYAAPLGWPSGPFSVVYADPPWTYYGDPNKDQACGEVAHEGLKFRTAEGLTVEVCRQNKEHSR